MVCSVNGCETQVGPKDARGWCGKHYARWRKYGDPVHPKPTLEERLLRRRHISDGHWLWTGSHNGLGYGELRVDYKKQYAHRLAYQLWIGEIPNGLNVCHRCDVPACFNPVHLFLGTQADNVADMHNKGRGDVSGLALGVPASKKVTKDQVRAIRADPRPLHVIAAQYGLHPSGVSSIKKRRYWTHVA